jgi:hypothetical protein
MRISPAVKHLDDPRSPDGNPGLHDREVRQTLRFLMRTIAMSGQAAYTIQDSVNGAYG